MPATLESRTTLRTLTREQKQSFERDGFLVVRQLFSKDEVEHLKQVFMAQADLGPVKGLFDVLPNAANTDPLARYPRMMHPHNHPELPVGDLALSTMLDSRYHDILHDLFDDEPIAAQSMFYFKPAGARGQSLHQDNFYLRVKPGSCMASWLSVDDADEENGTLVVVPGSHRMDIACPEEADQTVSFTSHHVPVPVGMEETAVILKAGDVLFFNGSLIHGSYPNVSNDRFRRSFICHYAPEGCEEISKYYKLFSFDGRNIERLDATGGGPCGIENGLMGPH